MQRRCSLGAALVYYTSWGRCRERGRLGIRRTKPEGGVAIAARWWRGIFFSHKAAAACRLNAVSAATAIAQRHLALHACMIVRDFGWVGCSSGLCARVWGWGWGGGRVWALVAGGRAGRWVSSDSERASISLVWSSWSVCREFCTLECGVWMKTGRTPPCHRGGAGAHIPYKGKGWSCRYIDCTYKAHTQ